MKRALAVLALIAAILPARGADIDVRVVNAGDAPVADAAVSLSRPEENWTTASCGRTGLDGRTTCRAREAGTYTVTAVQGANPYQWRGGAGSRVTLKDGESRAAIVVRLTDGDRIRVDVDLGNQVGRGQARFVERTRGEVVDIYEQGVLPPGEWRITANPKPGAIVVSLTIDREPAPTVDAVLVTRGGSTHTLEWRYESPCEIKGVTRWTNWRDPGPQPVAHLLRPGPRLAAALAQGAPFVGEVRASLLLDGEFSMFLADGTWLVTVQDDALASADPEQATIELAAGDVRELSFMAKRREGEPEKRTLNVRVKSPSSRAVRNAVAELRRPGGDPGSAPLRAERTSFGTATFDGLDPGDYVVTAGHENYGEATLDVPRLGDPESERSRTVELVLPPTAAIDIEGFGRDKRPLEGAEVTFEREDPLPEPRLVTDPALEQRRTGRTVPIDATGRARVTGLFEGRYRVYANPKRGASTPALLEVGSREASLARETFVELGSSGTVSLLVREKPAAALAMSVRCLDRGPLPPRTALRLLPLDTTNDGSSDAARYGPRLWPLVGPQERRLDAGPFAPGAYLTSLRPDGFARWTWAGGGEDSARAIPVDFAVGATKDLSPFEIDCSPAIRIEVSVKSRLPVPDLSDVEVQARYVPAGEGKTAVKPYVDRGTEALRLRRVPEGKGQLELRLRCPFFIPGEVRPVGDPLAVTLARGGEVVIPVAVDDIGGALVVDANPPALRLTAPDATTRVIAGNQVEHLPAGTYRVESCADAACTKASSPVDVDIVAGRWARL